MNKPCDVMIDMCKEPNRKCYIHESSYKECPEQKNPHREKVKQWLFGAERRRQWGVTANGNGYFVGCVCVCLGDKMFIMKLVCSIQSCGYNKSTELYTLKG